VSERLVLQGGRVLDPMRGGVDTARCIVTVGGRIQEVAPRPRDVRDARVIDLKGAVVMPGLIDCHVHVTVVASDVWAASEWSPAYVTARAARVCRDMLFRGFTTVRDVGGCDFGFAQAVAEGYFEGPRIVYGGKMLSQTGGAGEWRLPGRVVYDPHPYTPALATICDGVDQVRRAAREEIRRGASHIKMYLSGAVDAPSDRIDATQFSLDEIRAVVEEATAANIYVAGHAYTSRAINRALVCGVRTIEHGNLMDSTTPPLLVEHNAFYVPTLTTYEALARHGKEYGVPAEALRKLGPVLEGGLRALELCHRAGVEIAYGSDLLAEMHRFQSREFELRAGVQSAVDVIRSATIVGAKLLGLEREIGRVEEGFDADLLVLDRDPIEDIGVLAEPSEHIRLIVKHGRVVYERLDS